MKFYATIEFEDANNVTSKNATEMPQMPNFKAIFPELVDLLPTKGWPSF